MKTTKTPVKPYTLFVVKGSALALVGLAYSLTGCFAMQYDAINAQASARLQELDRQCRSNMTEWCVMQYYIVQSDKDRAIADLEVRRAIFAQGMQNAAQGLQNVGASLAHQQH